MRGKTSLALRAGQRQARLFRRTTSLTLRVGVRQARPIRGEGLACAQVLLRPFSAQTGHDQNDKCQLEYTVFSAKFELGWNQSHMGLTAEKCGSLISAKFARSASRVCGQGDTGDIGYS